MAVALQPSNMLLLLIGLAILITKGVVSYSLFDHSSKGIMSNSGRRIIAIPTAPPPTLTFTLGVVISNPNLTESMMRQILTAVEQPASASSYLYTQQHVNIFSSDPTTMPAQMLGRVNYRLQINPVNVNAMGLNRFLKALFCSRAAQGTNALFLLVDNAVQMNGMLSTFAKHINIPLIAWSSSAIDDQLQYFKTTEEVSSAWSGTLLLAPSIRSQARAIYAFMKKYYSEEKATIMASVTTPGCEAFIDEMRTISEQEDHRHSLFQYDSHQYHMSSRILNIIKVDKNFMENLPRELGLVRDHTATRAFILFADPFDCNVILEEAHHLGLTASDYVWIAGKPCLGPSEQSPIPPNYIPGLISVTYNTSLNAQIIALKTAIQVWSEGFRKFIHLVKSSSNSDISTCSNNCGAYNYGKVGANLMSSVHRKILAPTINCNNNSAIQKWQFGHLLYQAMENRLGRLMSPSSSLSNSSSHDAANMNDIVFLDLQFDRRWRRVGDWSASTGSVTVDHKWLNILSKHAHPSAKKGHIFVKVATLEEPPYVIYRYPEPKTGECDRLKSIPCRLSPLAVFGDKDSWGDFHIRSTMQDDSRVKNGTMVCCHGFSIDILRRLSQDIGFNFEIFEVHDRKWGAFDNATGQWNGLVQVLLDGTADMVMTSLKINSDRNSAIDFSVPFFETGVTILVRVREGMVSPFAFLEPFSLETWFIIFFICVNGFALITFTFEFLFHRITILTKDHNESNRYSLVDSFWLILNVLFNAPAGFKLPKCSSTRFITTVWSLVCLILVASFMANLAAFMITKDDYYDFSGIDDYRLKNPYTKNPAWRFATIPSGATETIIKSNFPDMYEYMRRFTRPNADAGVDAVRKGELDAFIYDASVLEYKVGRDKDCALRTVGKWYALTGYGVAVPKNSKWLQSLNKFIIDYQRSGYLQQLEQYWLSSACKERQLSDLRNKSPALGITNLRAVFGILATCIGACVVFLFIEHLFMRRFCLRHLRQFDKCSCFQTISPKMGAAIKNMKSLQLRSREVSKLTSQRSRPITSSGIFIKQIMQSDYNTSQQYKEGRVVGEISSQQLSTSNYCTNNNVTVSVSMGGDMLLNLR